MRRKIVPFVFFLLPSISGCAQQNFDPFQESNYIKVSQGPDFFPQEYPFVIRYVNKRDSNYKKKEVYFDSSYKDLLATRFFFKDVPTGPFNVYSNGRVLIKGYYLHGKLNGERLMYDEEGRIVRKGYYKDGKKIGTWEDYDKGRLVRRVTFDDDENIVADEIF